MRFTKILVPALLCTFFGISGCAASSSTAPSENRPPSDVPGPSNHDTPSTSASNYASASSHPSTSNSANAEGPTSASEPNSSSLPKDGSIVSMTQVSVLGNSDDDFYQLFYWSGGQKVEAYVVKPADSKMVYAIDLNLHGGWLIPRPGVSHSPLGVSIGSLKSIHESEYVMFFPQYRGYGESQGTVNDIYGNLKDATNAITAAKSLKFVNPTQLYVEGASMGGCIALMLAERSDVKAVVAVSPFVGWDIFREWTLQHPQSSEAQNLLNSANATLGSYAANQQTWANESLDVSKMIAPVLLLQGTADKTLPAGSVQELYSEMQKQGKTVQLNLIAGGNHGLTGKYQADAQYDAAKWFNGHW